MPARQSWSRVASQRGTGRRLPVLAMPMCVLAIALGLRPAPLHGQAPDVSLSPRPATAPGHRNYLGTSLFTFASLVPDGVFFVQIDYGRKLTPRADLAFGANVYRYVAPMSTPWNDDTRYPGHVLSYGIVFAHQRYVWNDIFLNGMVNPLILDYHDGSGAKIGTGFMLLCALRLGYHFDFDVFGAPLYLEAGGEVSFWPYNGNVPASFRRIDDAFPAHALSPALQFGYRF